MIKFTIYPLMEGEGGPTECFVADTKVTMADGSTKNIQDIKVG